MIAAVNGHAVAGGCVLAKQRIPIGARIALAGLALPFVIAAIVFAVRLSHVSWMKLSWAPLVAIVCAIAGAVATVRDPRAP